MSKRVNSAWLRLFLGGLGAIIAVMHTAGAAELADPLGGEAAGGTVTEAAAFQVNADDDDAIAVSRIARDADGNFVIVWQQSQAIYAQRYDYNGRRVDDTFRVDGDDGAATQPDVAMEPGGGFAVVWQRGGDIYLRRYGNDGAALAQPRWVNATTDGEQSAPAVALYQEVGSANQGDAVVVWQSASNAGSDIFARTFDGSGDPQQETDVPVNQATDGDQIEPSVGVSTSGSFVVAWAGSAPNGAQAILARRFDAMATAQGVAFQVNGTGPGVQRRPSVAVSANGAFAIAWRSRNQGATDIRVQRYDGDGVSNGGVRTASGIDVAADAAPRIALAATERAALVWAGQGGDVVARLFDADGQPEGPVRTLADDIDDASQMPDLAVDADGDFAATWRDDDAVRANRYVGGEPVDLDLDFFVNQSAVLIGESTDYQLLLSNTHAAATAATDILDINNAIGASQGARFVFEVPEAIAIGDVGNEDFDCEVDGERLECRASTLLRAGFSTGTPNSSTLRVPVSPNEAGIFQATGSVMANQIDPDSENNEDAYKILAEESRDRNAGTGGSGNGGGCTLDPNPRPVDPTFVLLLILALAVVYTRQKRARCLC